MNTVVTFLAVRQHLGSGIQLQVSSAMYNLIKHRYDEWVHELQLKSGWVVTMYELTTDLAGCETLCDLVSEWKSPTKAPVDSTTLQLNVKVPA